MIPDRPHFDLERRLHSQGYALVAGVDEAGRGPLAGPVSAGVAILPQKLSGDWVKLINDSKKLSAGQRETAYSHLQGEAVAVSVGFSSSQEIDSLGISSATRLAIRRALEKMPS
ncbi:MAG: ribonuclease HII, partial [SAR202 cluster bacterium]|nr:ribonuclease HII [SAR202 cluster bacterium]